MNGAIGMPASSLMSDGLPAPNLSTAASNQGQAQCSPALRWCTLPYIRTLVRQAVDKGKRSGPLIEQPSFLLGFHQDYPIVVGKSQMSYLVSWRSTDLCQQQPILTLESPFINSESTDIANPLFTLFHREVEKASVQLTPKPSETHLVDVLFDIAHLNPHFAAIVDQIPIISDSQLECYYREDITLTARQDRHYGRFGEKKIGTRLTVQLQVAVLKVRGGIINCPAPPAEPVVFFTIPAVQLGGHQLNTMPLAHPILLPPKFIVDPLYNTGANSESYLYGQTSSLSLASVTFHHLKTASLNSGPIGIRQHTTSVRLIQT
jgi:hypothetical protein